MHTRVTNVRLSPSLLPVMLLLLLLLLSLPRGVDPEQVSVPSLSEKQRETKRMWRGP